MGTSTRRRSSEICGQSSGIVRDFLAIEALDDAGKGQGLALVRTKQYQADEEGVFAYVQHVECSDQYYDWWTKNEMDKPLFLQRAFPEKLRAQAGQGPGDTCAQAGSGHSQGG